jgi:cell division protein FtsL
MMRLVNIVLVLTVLGSGFVLYTLEHATRAAERRIVEIETDIAAEAESIKLLKAEWSNLTRPERLQKLAEERLGLKPIIPTQMISVGELAARVPEKPLPQPEPGSADPLGDILKKME